MNHAQKYLAQANRQIAELVVQIACQRAIVKQALDTGQRSEMVESLPDVAKSWSSGMTGSGTKRTFYVCRCLFLGKSGRAADITAKTEF